MEKIRKLLAIHTEMVRGEKGILARDVQNKADWS
jgi:hypothetical protein